MVVKRFTKSLNANVSLPGFGCMRLPVLDNDQSKIDYSLGFQMFDLAIKNGVNYFDTSWPYHDKMSEVFVGQALSNYRRESYFLATKMPTWEKFKNPGEDMENLFSMQLKKCKVDYFDFYLIHALDRGRLQNVKNYNMHEFLQNKKKDGKIRRLGFSFHDNPGILKELVENYEWDFAQIHLNYLDWDESQNSKYQYEYLTEHNIPVSIMEPVRGGALAVLNKESAAVLLEENPNVSLASWAIRFAASLPNVVTVLSGMSDLAQVEDNIKTMSDFRPLNDAEYKKINEAANIYRKSGTIPCTACRYCTEYCSKHVDIPRIFSQYNFFNLRGRTDPGAFLNNYRTILESGQAHNCIACGLCISHCPQGIKIPPHLKEIADFAASIPWDD